MIDRDEIARAARNTDATLAELNDDLTAWWGGYDFDMEGVLYVARQRAVRAAMAIDGQDPRKLSTTVFETIHLSRTARALLPVLAATWTDGFAVRTQLQEQQ